MIYRIIICLLALHCHLVAAEVLLRNGNRLSGELESAEGGNDLRLKSPFSAEPLHLKNEAIAKILFAEHGSEIKLPTTRVELINGDTLPLKILSMDATLLIGINPSLGRIEIPRGMLRSIYLGIYARRLILGELGSFKGWERIGNRGKVWKVRQERIQSEGQGVVQRHVELPESFVIRFELGWRENPNFTLSFADPLIEGDSPVDRYMLQFAAGGLELKRESSVGENVIPIIGLNRTPDQFSKRKVDIELRVDRKLGGFELLLNGVFEGRYQDPTGRIPEHKGVSFESLAAPQSGQYLSGFEIREWDSRGARHRAETRGSGRKDALIGKYGERFGGRFEQVRSEGSETHFIFKSDLIKKRLEIPADEVSTIFMAEVSPMERIAEAEGLIVRLRGDGELRTNRFQFSDQSIIFEHPLLGNLEVQREGVEAIERRSLPKAIPVK